MVTSQEVSQRAKIGGGAWPGVVASGVLVAVYCLAWRRYGLELADEGVLLAHMDRVVHGQVPYRDFHVGYGPALYWVHAAAFAGWGASITTVRIGLALVHAARAALLAYLATALGGGRWAAVAVCLLLAFFLPIAPGVCAPGNIPYPAWYADVVGLVAVLLIARPSAPSVVVGLAWGIVFAFKQNSGVLGLGAAVATTILAGAAPSEDGRALPVAVAVAMPLAALVLLRDYVDATAAAVFVVPLMPLAAAVGRARIGRPTVVDVMGLLAGFLAVAGGTVGIMVARAGSAAVAMDFLQIGTDTIRTYHVAFPTLGAVAADVRAAPLGRGLRIASDVAWFAILPAAHLVATSRVASGRIHSRAGIAVVAAATLGYLALYPRMDFWHVLPLAPASLATLVLLGASLRPAWSRAVAVALVLWCVGRLAPTVPVLATVLRAPARVSRIPRLDLDWDLLTDERLVRLPDVVDAVRGRARVAGFPALGVVNFALGAPSPWRHDYFFPGRPTADEEPRLVADVLRDPPDAVVVLDAPSGPFAEAFTAHPALVGAIESRMTEARRIGPYRILVPRAP